MNNASKGLLIVISGPAGSGKGTVVKLLREMLPDLGFSVSATTRAPRPGEEDGVQYYFMTRDDFEDALSRGEILEHTVYVGNYYGTPKAEVERVLSSGRDLILEIETDGAMQVKRIYPDAVTVMLIPPDAAVLEECGALAAMTMDADFGAQAPSRTTTGQTLYRTRGIGGIRAEAAAGFPCVQQIALPVLTRLLDGGMCANDAGAYTLLALLGRVTDTNMIARGGMDSAEAAKAAALSLLPDLNGDLPDLSALRILDQQFIRYNLSPGGCADLLAISFFLYHLNKETLTWQT